jgi:protein MAK11
MYIALQTQKESATTLLSPVKMSSQLPDRLMIAAGTYDGVLAGWDTIQRKTDKNEKLDKEKGDQDLLQMLNSASPQDENAYLKMSFAMAVHDGSVRCLSIASNANQQNGNGHETSNDAEIEDHPVVPGTLLSGGYDESLAIFSLTKYAQAGELKTPSNLGTPTCSSFAPPKETSPSHVLVGLSTGKIIIYKRNDMSVQHILPGHDDKGVSCITVHPSGKMALSGGRDGKICLWDLMRGRLAFVNKLKNPSKGRKATVNHIVWSGDGLRYAYCTHEGNIQAREMESGQTLLDIDMHPGGRANQISFIGGEDGIFLAAACNDGGLPVFAVGSVDEGDEEEGTRRAIMAIEPVQGVATAGDERFKCIQSVSGGSGFLVVTANSGGIISVVDLEGAAQMMLSDDNDGGGDGDDDGSEDSDEEDSDSDDEEVAAEILESVRIGSGARITCISAWSYTLPLSEPDENFDEEIDVKVLAEDDSLDEEDEDEKQETGELPFSKKRKVKEIVPVQEPEEIELDEEALEKARALVSQAKKRQKRKKKKAQKNNQ